MQRHRRGREADRRGGAGTIIDGGPYLADGARQAGLVDDLAYEDQLDDTEPMNGTQPVDATTYARAARVRRDRASGGRIALLYAVGTIASGKSSFDSPTRRVLGSETFIDWIRKVRVDPRIRAVVVRIDSPGGSAIASEVIWRELMLTRDVKPRRRVDGRRGGVRRVLHRRAGPRHRGASPARSPDRSAS